MDNRKAAAVKIFNTVTTELHRFFKENFTFFILTGIVLLFIFLEALGLYYATNNSTLVNPFIQRIWGWLFLYGLLLLPGGRVAKILTILLFIIQSVLVAVSVFLLFKFTLPLSGDIILIIAESSPGEAKEFFAKFFSIGLLCAVTAFALLTVLGIILTKKAALKRCAMLYITAIVLMLPQIINTIRFSASGDYEDIYIRNSLANFFARIHATWTENTGLQVMKKSPQLPANIRMKAGDKNPLVVLVIGESATRFHHSLYGYFRPTTPRLDQYRSELLAFSDVLSSSASTIRSLRYLLTTEEKEHPGDFRYSLFDVFKAAGFRVFFCSNQSRWGKYDTPIALMTAHADRKIYLQEEHPFAYDDRLSQYVPVLAESTDAPTLIVLHLYGSHTSYDQRYPSPAKFFKDNQIYPVLYKTDSPEEVDDYDNSIRFTDAMLGKMLDYIKQSGRPAAFIYLSDHGDCPELIKQSPRSAASKLPDIYEIPFIFYANPEYLRTYPDFIKQASANLSKPYQTDHATYAIISAAQITFDNFPCEKDIFSSRFIPREKRFLGESNSEYRTRKGLKWQNPPSAGENGKK